MKIGRTTMDLAGDEDAWAHRAHVSSSTVLSHLRGKFQAPLAAPRRALARLWTSAISKGGYAPGEVFPPITSFSTQTPLNTHPPPSENRTQYHHPRRPQHR